MTRILLAFVSHGYVLPFCEWPHKLFFWSEKQDSKSEAELLPARPIEFLVGSAGSWFCSGYLSAFHPDAVRVHGRINSHIIRSWAEEKGCPDSKPKGGGVIFLQTPDPSGVFRFKEICSLWSVTISL